MTLAATAAGARRRPAGVVDARRAPTSFGERLGLAGAIERHSRQHLGREHLRERAVGELMPGDATADLARAPPARPRARREPQHDAHALFVVALGVQRKRLARAPIHRAHLARERARGEPRRERQPLFLIIGRRHSTQEAQLRPADLAGAERRVE